MPHTNFILAVVYTAAALIVVLDMVVFRPF